LLVAFNLVLGIFGGSEQTLYIKQEIGRVGEILFWCWRALSLPLSNEHSLMLLITFATPTTPCPLS
jgi:hypothetical protein